MPHRGAGGEGGEGPCTKRTQPDRKESYGITGCDTDITLQHFVTPDEEGGRQRQGSGGSTEEAPLQGPVRPITALALLQELRALSVEMILLRSGSGTGIWQGN